MTPIDQTTNIQVLGSVAVCRDGDTQHLRELSARLLSALVIADRAGLTNGAAVEAIWDEPPKTALIGLRGHVQRLRQALSDEHGEVVITLDQGGYRLELDPHRLDAYRFEQDCLAAEAAIRRRAFDEALTCGRRALEMWGDEPYVGCDEVPGVTSERVRLIEVWIRLVSTVAEGLLASRRAGEAVGLMRPVVVKHPDNEGFARLLMRALAAADRKSEALKEFERLETTLHQEFGEPPSTETISLLDQISVGETAQDTQLGNPVVAIVPGDSPPLVGRETELAFVLDAIRTAATGVKLTTIMGPAGIGKTRLLVSCADQVFADGGAVLFGSADRSMLSFGVFRSLFQNVDATSAGDPIGTLRPVLARIAPELVATSPTVPSVTTDERWREDVFSAVGSWVADLVAPVMFLDDFQWIDQDSLDLIRSLSRDQRLSDLKIVASLRTDSTETATPDVLQAEFLRSESLRTLTLGPLDEDALVALAQGIWTTTAVSQDLIEKTGGNALLAVEYAKSRARSASPAPDPEGAEPLELIVRARLSELGPDGKAVVRVAATLGHRFMQREVMIGLGDQAVFANGMAQCSAVDLFSPTTDPGWYQFTHGLLQEQIARQVSDIERQALQLRLFNELAAGDPERRALCAFGAADLLSSREVLDACIDAGEAALRKSAFAKSAEFFEQAVAIQKAHLPLRRTDECRMLVRFAQTQLHVDESRAEQILREAGTLARPLADAVLVADIADVRIGMNIAPDSADIELLETALSWPSVTDDSSLRARLSARLAVDVLGVDPTDRAHQLAQRAIDIANRLEPGSEKDHALLRGMWAQAFTGDVRHGRAERAQFLEDYRSLGRAVGNADAELLAEAHIAVLQLEQRDYAAAEAAATRMRDLAERQSWPRYLAHAIALTAAIASERGEHSEASRLSDIAKGISETAGYVEGMTYVPLGHEFCRKFHEGTVAEVADVFGGLWHGDDQPPIVGCAFAAAAAAAGRIDAARDAIDKAAGQDLSDLPRDTVYTTCLTFIASAAFDLGDGTYTEPGLELMEPLRGTNIVAGAGIGLFGPAEATIGRFLAAAGDTQAAELELRVAHSICLELGALSPVQRIESDLRRLESTWSDDDR